MKNRFYPNEFPEFWNEPTKENFDIVTVNDEVGVGVIAKANFAKGQEIFRFTGFITSKVSQFSLEIKAGMHINDPWFMGRVLHSCNPNCVVDMDEMSFVATRAISTDEFITMDYNSTETLLYKSFECDCVDGCESGVIGGCFYEHEPDGNKIERCLIENNWRFAKTLSHIPHSYSRGREWKSFDDFVWCCEYIQKNSKKDTFSPTGKYYYNYFFLGKYKYWVMERDKPSSEQILINRAETKHVYPKDLKL